MDEVFSVCTAVSFPNAESIVFFVSFSARALAASTDPATTAVTSGSEK
jgi:hypothetical protein